MRKAFGLLVVLMVVLCSSCTTDIDLTANWKDISVVYGLLDHKADTQYIRINKAFLGEADAAEMAKNPDSLKYNNLTVMLTEYDFNDNMVRTMTFTPVTHILKDTGYFAHQNHIVYAAPSTDGNGSMHQNNRYELTITNNETGKVITSETELPNTMSLSQPSSAATKYTLANQQGEYFEKSRIEWVTGPDSKRYEIWLKYRWQNVIFSGTDTISVDDSIRFKIGQDKTLGLEGSEQLGIDWNTGKFFDKVKDHITSVPNYNANVFYRRSGSCDLEFVIAGDALNTYMEVNEPSNSIVQERPEFTNLVTEDKSAIGVFSSRTVQKKLFADISAWSINKLKTEGLLFCDPSVSITNPVPCPQ